MRKVNRLRIVLGMALTLSLTSQAVAQPKLTPNNIDDIVKAMTLQEKALIVVGTGSEGPYANLGTFAKLVPGAAGSTVSIPRLGITSVVMTDGPAGVRINPTRDYDSRHTYYCTHFPIGTCLSSSWNVELVQQVGAAIGNETLEYGCDVLLAPGICIQRNPLCGRNFEYYSEDPFLAGNIAAAYILGVQSQGVGTSIKHFAFNNQETARLGNDVRVSQRAAREIYLKNFEIAIKKSNPWTVMSSYNGVNGKQTSERRDLLTTILRDEWGYKGMVVTDWTGGMDPVWRDGASDRVANMIAGNDLIEPGEKVDTETIEKAVKSGKLDVKYLDQCVKRILQLVVKTPRFKGYKYSNKPNLEAHAQVTRNSAAEGIVLLENKNVLPFENKVQNIALYGIASYSPIAGGTGSGNVNRAYTVSLVEGLRNNHYRIDEAVLASYTNYIKKANDEIDKQPREWWQSKPLPAEIVPSVDSLEMAAKINDVAVITLCRQAGEGTDRKAEDFYITDTERQLIREVTEQFHKVGKKTVVVLNMGGVMETASWKQIPDAILLPWQCGQEIGNSVADVLSGRLSPSGKLPMTWPIALDDVASTANFPTDGIQIGFSDHHQDKYKTVRNVGYTNYEEDIYVGYRYFDTFHKNVSYPFGYGLSYTTFDYQNASVKDKNDYVEVKVDVKNTGTRVGKEIVEIYVTAPKGKVEKPAQELKAFAKTHALKPGETETLTMQIKKEDLASFNEKASSWIVDAGKYAFKVAASSRDIKKVLYLNVAGSKKKVNDVLKPQVKLKLLKQNSSTEK